MQGRNVIIVSVLLLPLISCSKIEKTNGQVEVVQLTEESLPPVQPLKLEKVDLPEEYTMGNSTCIMYQDTILIVLKDGDPYPLKYMLTLVNMNTGEKIGEYFTRGNGPNELLSTLPRLSHNCLDIFCYTTNKLVPFNIDSAIMYGNNYRPSVIRVGKIMFGEWCSMDDTLFLTTNMFYFDGSNEFNKNARLPEFYWYTKSEKIIPEFKESDYRKAIPMALDVSGSTISINKDKKRIICCYRHQPYVKIFDLDMNLLKIVSGPEPDDTKYIVLDGNRIYFDLKDGRTDYYSYAVCDDDNIIVINERLHKKKRVEPELFKLDWDGNVIGRYSANGKHIYTHNYCNNSNTLYLWVREDGEYSMYKAKLD